MLTKEAILKQAALAGLTEEQIGVIVTLSSNDENAVIAQRIGETAGRIEGSVAQLSGIPKKPAEKYYDYVDRVVSSLKESSAGGSVDELTAEIATLKEQLKGTADPAGQAQIKELEKSLADEKNRVQELRTQITNKETEYNKKLSEQAEQTTEIEFRNQWNQALQGRTRRPGLSEDDFKELNETRLNKALKEFKRELETTSDGNRVMRLKNEAGYTVNNESNANNPLTVAELALQRVSGLFEPARIVEGGGKKPLPPEPAAGAKKVGSVDLGFRVTGSDKAAASREIISHLADAGVATNHPDYQATYKALYEANEVSALPLQSK